MDTKLNSSDTEQFVESVIRTAIEQATDKALHDLQDQLGITNGDYSFDVAIRLQEHLDALVKDYCDILNGQLGFREAIND